MVGCSASIEVVNSRTEILLLSERPSMDGASGTPLCFAPPVGFVRVLRKAVFCAGSPRYVDELIGTLPAVETLVAQLVQRERRSGLRPISAVRPKSLRASADMACRPNIEVRVALAAIGAYCMAWLADVGEEGFTASMVISRFEVRRSMRLESSDRRILVRRIGYRAVPLCSKFWRFPAFPRNRRIAPSRRGSRRCV